MPGEASLPFVLQARMMLIDDGSEFAELSRRISR